MKNIITVLCVSALMLSLFAGCGKKTECDFCGEEKSCVTKTVYGEKMSLCNDCIAEFKEMY